MMDEQLRKKVIQYCTKIGILMEDARAPAIICAGLDKNELRLLVNDLAARIDEMSVLAAAAAAAAILRNP